MFLRIATIFFLVLSLLLGLAAVAVYYLEQPNAPGAVVEEPDRVFDKLAVGKNEVVFKLRNPTRHKVRVVGYNFC